jgi:gliding motility-associated-like protein
MDSFSVSFDPFVSEVYTKDTGLCFPGTHTLFAPAGYSNYVWNDGSTNTAYEVTSTGKYVVRSFAYCYERSDTINVNFTPYTFSLGPDTTVCMNYLLAAPIPKEGVATYRWQDGTTYPTYSAYRTGIYYVTVNNNGCIATDTIAVTFRKLVQNIHDTFVCKHEAINYPVSCTPPADGTVMWNDGITATRRTFTDSGTWWVYVSAGDCQILDTVRITTDYCECWHQIPDAFTPNGDGLNDVAGPLIEPGCNISGYYFSLYNRWGELVFTSDSRNKGWDGTYKGTACDIGVYMYVVNFYVGVKNTPVMKSGTITLVR